MEINRKYSDFLLNLKELRMILEDNGEKNWIRGINSAIFELENDKDNSGFEKASSIYKTMTLGGRGFSEYYLRDSACGNVSRANRLLDQIREKLWSAVES